MSLHVVVTDATNLPNVETLGQSDPYTIVEYQGIHTHILVFRLLMYFNGILNI